MNVRPLRRFGGEKRGSLDLTRVEIQGHGPDTLCFEKTLRGIVYEKRFGNAIGRLEKKEYSNYFVIIRYVIGFF